MIIDNPAPLAGSQKIQRQILSGTGTFTFSNIPQTFNSLLITGLLRTNNNDVFDDVEMELNGDTTDGNYRGSANYAGSITGGGGNFGYGYVGTGTGNTATANVASGFYIFIPAYTNTTFHKVWAGTASAQFTTTYYAYNVSGKWANTAAITQILWKPRTGTLFLAGCEMTLFGLQ